MPCSRASRALSDPMHSLMSPVWVGIGALRLHCMWSLPLSLCTLLCLGRFFHMVVLLQRGGGGRCGHLEVDCCKPGMASVCLIGRCPYACSVEKSE
jgi:hypothetical protein